VEPSPQLCETYCDAGWWDGSTLSTVLADALDRSGACEFRVHSVHRPWRGTLAEVAGLGRRVAAGLSRRGVRPGDPVAFQFPNSAEAAATFYGLALLGAVLVPIGHSSGVAETRHALRESGARALLAADWDERRFPLDAITDSDADLPNLEHVVLASAQRDRGASTLRFGDLIEADPTYAIARVEPAAPAVIGWTSGTTAAPKGVLLSHRGLCAESRWHMAPLARARSRPPLSTSPVSHVTGMLLSLLVPPLIGQDVHLLDYWDPRRVLTVMDTEGLAAGSGAPLFLATLIDDPACSARHRALIHIAALGGTAVAPDLITRADSLGIVALRGYGSTEHPSVSLGRPTDELDKRAQTDGAPCPGVEVHIVDDAGNACARGQAGEVLSRGPDLFCGYTDARLNAEAFDRGWYRTGDVGVLDEHGYLTIVDRKKDIIIRSGMNISAAEVEAALLAMPQVAEVAVVAAPDVRTGERACAFIRPPQGHQVPGMEDIHAHLARAGIAKYKWPEEIRAQVGDFPRSPAGKVRKSDLRQQLGASAAPA
jgi:acyl-CoA synthetase